MGNVICCKRRIKPFHEIEVGYRYHYRDPLSGGCVDSLVIARTAERFVVWNMRGSSTQTGTTIEIVDIESYREEDAEQGHEIDYA